MSNKPNLDQLEIRTGLIVNPNMITLLIEDRVLAEKDVPYTEIAVWQNGKDWHRSSINHNGVSAAVFPGKPGVNRQLVIVGDTGRFTELSGGAGTDGVIEDEHSMASVSLVHGSIMAVGIVGGVFRMTGKTTWENLTDQRVEENIEAICGHPSGDFLVSGWGGLVARYGGGGPERIETGTNVILTDIVCDDKGEIVVCGQRGTLLRGTTDGLVPLKLAGIADDFWSVAKFQGEVYVASTTALYRLVDDTTLELVTFEDEEVPTSFYHLDTYQDSLMLSVGQRDAVLYDGNEWTRIL
jgi:hypothetical protein